LQEGVDFVLAEEGAVHLELLSHGLDFLFGHLVKFERFSVDDVSSNILFQQVDDLQSFLVVLDGSNEKLVAVALVVLKNLDLSVDFILSEFVPGDVILGSNKLLLEPNSVLLRSDEKLLVQVLDLGELGDSGCSDQFVSLVLSVSCELGIEVGLLKVLEEIEDGIDGITGFGSSLQQGQNLVGFGGGSS
jgi:hypothetical protein